MGLFCLWVWGLRLGGLVGLVMVGVFGVFGFEVMVVDLGGVWVVVVLD